MGLDGRLGQLDKKLVAVFQRTGLLYRARFMEPGWGARDLRNPRQALALFLLGYGFERQGADPSYAQAASQVVSDPSWDGTAEEAWWRFRALMNDRRLNEKLNPLQHRPPPAKCSCIVDCLSEPGSALRNICETGKDALTEPPGAVAEYLQDLQRIRGIGPKIASFYLRDVSLWSGIVPHGDRELLQPIDVWIRRTVALVSSIEPDSITTQEAQLWMLRTFDQPELANAGVWYFGAQVARSEFGLRQVIQDPGTARGLVNRHVKILEKAAARWAE